MTNLEDQERTIQGEAKECRSLLMDVMVYVSRHDPFSIGIELQDELGRFNLWAGNIGVFAPLQASLDFRLIDVPDIRAQFLRQLDTLSITLTQLNEAAVQASKEESGDPQVEDAIRESDGSLLLEHDMIELVQSIHVTIDWLHRLSNLVRKASFGSQNQRAARFPLEDEAGNDITECLTDMFKHLITRECCDISDQILNRLAQTMIIRRRRVLYRRSRQKRWILQQEAYRPRHLDPPVQLSPLQEEKESGEDQKNSEVMKEIEFEPESRVQAAPSALTVTTLDQQKYRKLAAPSQISRATTAPFQHNEKLLVPLRPSLAKEGKEFVCDYCCLIIPSSEAADQDTWANHVKKDLDPYICVFEDCSQPYQIFSSSKEWLAHMRSEHRMSWRCVVRDHPPQTFDTREAFLNHMTEAHPGMFRQEQLPFIAESSARPLSPTVPACPFCAEESGDLENHVAQHLCHFALQSLPWPDHLDQGSEIMSGQEMNSSTFQDVERETLKDDLDDSLGFIDVEWLDSMDTEPEPLLDTPASWPSIERIFPEPDQVLSEFAAHAARRAIMASNVNHGEPGTLDDELRQVKEQFPDIVWNDADMDTHLLRASLRGPWGFGGEYIGFSVKVAVPYDYPKAQAPSFLIEDDEYMPQVVREMLQREVQEICQLYLQLKEACLAASFSYLLGEHNLASSINMFNVERGHAIPLGDVDEDKPPASPDLQAHGVEFAKATDKSKSMAPEKTEVQPKSGYLTKRGKNFGSWKSRFYVVDGPQLKYYDAEGGAQLGSIKLEGARIGKQQPRDDTTSADDTQYKHAMLILEPKKGAQIKHILCAESGEERDLWVEALLPWIDSADSKDRVKTAELDRPGVSESQTDTPQPSTFLVQVYEKSGQFRPVDHPSPYISISSATVANCPIHCQLDVSKTEFGTFNGLAAGIIYMDIIIGEPHKNLESVTITVTLDNNDPDLQRAVWGASANDFGGFVRAVTLADPDLYGPKSMVIGGSKGVETRNSGSQPEAEATSTNIGGIGAGLKKTISSSGAWRISSNLPHSKNVPPLRSIRWDISNDLDTPSLHRNPIHTGLVFHGGGRPFSLKVEIEGKSSKISDRIKSIQLARNNRNSSKRGKILLHGSNERVHQLLDEVARALPEALDRANQLQFSLKDPGAISSPSLGMPTRHGLDEFDFTQETFDPSSRWGARRHEPRVQPREGVNHDERINDELSSGPEIIGSDERILSTSSSPEDRITGVPAAIAAAGGPADSSVHRVQLDFTPTLEDEMELHRGQVVRLLHEYDDGWALCIRLDRSQQGVVPRTCLSTLPVKPRPHAPPHQAVPRG